MNKRWLLRGAGAVVATSAAIVMLAGCGSDIQPSLGQYAITTGHGYGSNQQVLAVASPGEQVHVGNGTTTWYVYASPRNYVTGPGGDRGISAQLLTGTAAGQPAIPVTVRTYVPFELNPKIGVNKAFAEDFLKFCLKYGCASQNPQNSSNVGAVKSSIPGWNQMLAENFPIAIDNATRVALEKFGPSIWTDQSQWPVLAADIQSQVQANLNELDGSPAGSPYFCGLGSTDIVCKPISNITVQGVIPPGAVQAAYQQGNTAVYQHAAANARLKNAQILYGKDANWVLGIEDIENNCPIKCTIYVGNAPLNPSNGG